MTIRERNQWLIYIEQQRHIHEKQDWYLAQIAYELYLVKFMLGGKPKHKISDFLLKFETPIEKKFEQMTSREKREYIDKKAEQSKSFWQAMVGKKATEKKKSEAKAPKVKNGNNRKHHRSPRQSRR